MQQKEKKNHGGRRENAGRKAKFDEPTIMLQIKIPQRLKSELIGMINEYAKNH